MNRIVLSTSLAIASVTPFVGRGQGLPENPNRFSFGPTFGINFKAEFHDNANPGPSVTPAGGANPPAAGKRGGGAPAGPGPLDIVAVGR